MEVRDVRLTGVSLTVNRENTARSLTVFAALVLFGVLGRLLQPDWNIAPVAAVGGFAAYYFGSTAIAMVTAVAVMAISNFWLPAYDSPGMMVAVLAAYVVRVGATTSDTPSINATSAITAPPPRSPR